MSKSSLVVFAMLCCSLELAHAQQEQQRPDPAFLQRAIVALQAQRNQAMDAAATEAARASGLAEELAKTQALMKQLDGEHAKPPN